MISEGRKDYFGPGVSWLQSQSTDGKMICNLIEYLNIWFVCLKSCKDYKLCLIGVQGKNHFVFCKTVAVMFLRVSLIFQLAGILSWSPEKKSFHNSVAHLPKV